MNKFLVALVLLASCAAPQRSQSRNVGVAKPAAASPSPESGSKTIDAARLLEDVRVLSSDEMEGRGMGTQGGVKARAFVITRFADLKLKTFGDSYEKPFDAGVAADGASKIKPANVVGYVEGSKHPERF